MRVLEMCVLDVVSKVTSCTRVHFKTHFTSKCDCIASQFLDLSYGYQRQL